jgi:hypothetical protein
MKQEIEITVPTNWSAVTLRQYLKLKRDLDVYKDNDEAIIAALFHHLCGMDAAYISRLDIQTYTAIQKDLTEFFNNTNLPLQKIITIGGKKYGFEPNLSNMAYGAYVDLGKYETLQIDDKWAEVMSILYRPVTKQIGESYQIKAYDAVLDGELFLDIPMHVHFGALSFFFRLLTDYQKGILKYLETQQEVEIPHHIKSILAESGKLTLQSTNLPTGMLQNMRKSYENR